jgi:ABC-type uncharacterized transport system ATPase subunit
VLILDEPTSVAVPQENRYSRLSSVCAATGYRSSSSALKLREVMAVCRRIRPARTALVGTVHKSATSQSRTWRA